VSVLVLELTRADWTIGSSESLGRVSCSSGLVQDTNSLVMLHVSIGWNSPGLAQCGYDGMLAAATSSSLDGSMFWLMRWRRIHASLVSRINAQFMPSIVVPVMRQLNPLQFAMMARTRR